MPTLEEYERRVAELEIGEKPRSTEDLYALLNDIFMARWTMEELKQAQRLICRLEMLRRYGKPGRHEEQGAAG